MERRKKCKPILSRLVLLGDGRCHYLEFLRNLAAQILILAICWVMAKQMDFTEFDFSNTIPTVTFYILLALAAIAYYANASLLYESCFKKTNRWIARVGIRVNRKTKNYWDRLRLKVYSVADRKLIEFLEMLIIIYMCVTIFPAIVIVHSIFAAGAFVRNVG